MVAIKLCAQHDARIAIPVFGSVAAGFVHYTKATDELTCEPGSFLHI
jgi:hypothetical protein